MKLRNGFFKMINIWTNFWQRKLRKRKKAQINIVKEGTITEEPEIQMVIREFYQLLYGNTFANLDKIDISLEKYNLLGQTQKNRKPKIVF